jgi:hypothetical protein
MNVIENEVWRIVNDYQNYEVSSHGRVRNVITGRILKPVINSAGYYNIILFKEGKRKIAGLHRVVAAAFCENLDNKTYVDHRDRCRVNNNCNNLRWVTFSENCRNRSINKNNTSGKKGINFHKPTNSWIARIYNNEGKRLSKSFSINKYGDDDAKQRTINWRRRKEIEFGYDP